MKEYKCEYYSVQAAENSCFFCQHCTDIFFDYTNGPYMFICDEDADTTKGYDGQCKLFICDNTRGSLTMSVTT